jgi:hypothetical protein
MALNLYRRHGSHCLGGRALHHRTYEADELRRGWKKCACPIYASGTLNGRFNRKNTGRADWTSAKTIAAEWERVAPGTVHRHPLHPSRRLKSQFPLVSPSVMRSRFF